MHKKPRGHSNLYAEETEPYPTREAAHKACIPMVGGSQVSSCKPLPPLALAKAEWALIGLKMGWIGKSTYERLK